MLMGFMYSIRLSTAASGMKVKRKPVDEEDEGDEEEAEANAPPFFITSWNLANQLSAAGITSIDAGIRAVIQK